MTHVPSNLNGIRIANRSGKTTLGWQGPLDSLAFDEAGIRAKLLALESPCFIVEADGRIGVTQAGHLSLDEARYPLWASLAPLRSEQLGNPDFQAWHGVKYAYAAGAMANGIASEELVIAMGRELLLSSFGAAGLLPDQIEGAIHRIQAALPEGPYAFNLIHSPNEEILEQRTVELYLQHAITTVEASAFLRLTPHVVRYRAAGLSVNQAGQIEIKNKLIAKLSRREIATLFLQPAPADLLAELVSQSLITEQQAQLAARVPLADDITVEADSGGHTDNRPLVSLLPSLIALRDEIQEQFNYPVEVRVGAGGGIGTPEAALAAFTLGADYVVTGSINQACVEAGASRHTKNLLAQAAMTDVIMAPAADMFELGVKVQLLKRGTLFPMRAQKLYELYRAYDSLETIPKEEREKLEKQIFRCSLDEVWQATIAFFQTRAPEQIALAEADPKHKLALIFRWYLGLSSRWSNVGEPGREMDYQIWCGPAMGAFNDWVRGSYLESPERRYVAEIAHQIMWGAAFLARLRSARIQGIIFPARVARYRPDPKVISS